MARVPTRENFRVLPGGGSSGRVGANSSGLASVQGRDLQQVGAAVQRAGGIAGQMVEREQDRINQARVREAALGFREEMAEAEREYQQYKGAELVAGDKPILRDIEARIEQSRSQLLTGLGSRDAQDAFDQVSSGMSAGFRERAAAYEAQQADFYVEQQRDGTIHAQFETAISNPDKRATSLQSANSVLREQFEDQGFDGDRLNQKTQESMGALLAGQVNVLLDSEDTETARSMLEESRDYLSADMALSIDTAIGEKEKLQRVEATAADIWDKADGDYSDAKAMTQMVHEDDQEDVQRRLITLRQRDDAAEAENKRTAIVGAWEHFEQGGTVSTLPREIYEDLGAQTRMQMRNAEKAQARAAAAGPKRVTDRQAYNDFYGQMETGDATAALSFLNANADKISERD